MNFRPFLLYLNQRTNCKESVVNPHLMRVSGSPGSGDTAGTRHGNRGRPAVQDVPGSRHGRVCNFPDSARDEGSSSEPLPNGLRRRHCIRGAEIAGRKYGGVSAPEMALQTFVPVGMGMRQRYPVSVSHASGSVTAQTIFPAQGLDLVRNY